MSVKPITFDIYIDGTQQDCYDAICDFETYPEWQSSIKSAKTLLRDADGRPLRVEFTLDAVFRQVRYVLEYGYDESRYYLTWKFVRGDLKDVEGSYLFEDAGDGITRAVHTQKVDVGVWVPSAVYDRLTNVTMKGSMQDLKKRVESRTAQAE